MSTGDARTISQGDIQMVRTLIEQCLPYYMTQKQVIDILYQQERVEPSFTELVWQRLEEQNQEFFKGYHLRLMVKEQIMEFNKLLDRQAALMHQLGPSNGSHLPQMHQNYGLPITSGDLSAHSRRNDVLPNMLNSNLGMAQGTNGVVVKTEAGYPGTLGFMYGADSNVVEARQAVSSFSCLESDPHQLNGTLLNDNSLFSLFGSMSQNFGLSDSTADFTNSSDMLESFSRSAFLSSERDNFLDSHSSTVEHQGENKTVDIPDNLGFEDFGGDS